jgi:hypothetical protein
VFPYIDIIPTLTSQSFAYENVIIVATEVQEAFHLLSNQDGVFCRSKNV